MKVLDFVKRGGPKATRTSDLLRVRQTLQPAEQADLCESQGWDFAPGLRPARASPVWSHGSEWMAATTKSGGPVRRPARSVGRGGLRRRWPVGRPSSTGHTQRANGEAKQPSVWAGPAKSTLPLPADQMYEQDARAPAAMGFTASCSGSHLSLPETVSEDRPDGRLHRGGV